MPTNQRALASAFDEDPLVVDQPASLGSPGLVAGDNRQFFVRKNFGFHVMLHAAGGGRRWVSGGGSSFAEGAKSAAVALMLISVLRVRVKPGESVFCEHGDVLRR